MDSSKINYMLFSGCMDIQWYVDRRTGGGILLHCQMSEATSSSCCVQQIELPFSPVT